MHDSGSFIRVGLVYLREGWAMAPVQRGHEKKALAMFPVETRIAGGNILEPSAQFPR